MNRGGKKDPTREYTADGKDDDDTAVNSDLKGEETAANAEEKYDETSVNADKKGVETAANSEVNDDGPPRITIERENFTNV